MSLRAEIPEVNAINRGISLFLSRFRDLLSISGRMPQCSVPGCTRQGGHKDPLSSKPLSDNWIVAIKREEHGKKGRLWKPTKNARMCHNISTPVIIKHGKYLYRCPMEGNLFSKSMNTYQWLQKLCTKWSLTKHFPHLLQHLSIFSILVFITCLTEQLKILIPPVVCKESFQYWICTDNLEGWAIMPG